MNEFLNEKFMQKLHFCLTIFSSRQYPEIFVNEFWQVIPLAMPSSPSHFTYFQSFFQIFGLNCSSLFLVFCLGFFCFLGKKIMI